MKLGIELAIRALAGGLLVAAFALIGEAVRPKAFAGLFSAAPSVAVAGLAIVAVTKSPAVARLQSMSMVVGGIGLTASCVLASAAIPRIKTVAGSLAAWACWAAVSLGLYWAVFIGGR